ncbi:testis-specific serine/threonine-protein kinase 3-like [Cimex lectularius]|uniref:Protein kinase domain-containing protein n=1 Tax=Cimex lectularius TaxID=79782 RepID=A0A8I6S1M9_CIMLE|nr:testis-specific serine/threonine-protein kinase 3-like [Cimex lectularius]
MRAVRSPLKRESGVERLLQAGSTGHCSVVKIPGAFGESINAILNKRGFKLGKTIGEGSYCKVRVAFRATELGYTQRLACKVINKKRASRDFVTKFLPREVSIVKTIRHPNIVTVYNVFELEDQVYMFMDFCERGDLLDHIRNKGSFTETRAKHFFRQIVNAVEYLHARDIAHRDLKCENVLLSSRDQVKIADFGFSRWCRDLTTNKRILSDTFCGSAAYAAPEILQGIKYNPKMYDVWSMGCILYIMLCATMPFDDTNVKQMLKIQTMRKLTFPTKCILSGRARRLILHILEPDVTRRATINQIAGSQWLSAACTPN